jgi:hypothetical protein
MPDVNLNSDCPGFAMAARRESELRTIPFLGLNEKLCGHEVRPLTLRHVLWLELCKSPFLTRLPPEILVTKPGIEHDVTNFLWIVSPRFKAGNARRRKKFNREFSDVVKLKIDDAVTQIVEFVGEAWLDAGEGDPGDRSYYATATVITGIFCKHFGLGIDAWENCAGRNLIRRLTGKPNPLDIPLKIAFQMLRLTQRWQNPEAPLENKLSDAAIENWMRETNTPTPEKITELKAEAK